MTIRRKRLQQPLHTPVLVGRYGGGLYGGDTTAGVLRKHVEARVLVNKTDFGVRSRQKIRDDLVDFMMSRKGSFTKNTKLVRVVES